MRISTLSSFVGVFVLAAVFLLPACSRYDFATLKPSQKVDLQTASYAAADMLAMQAKHVLSPDSSLAVGTLSDINAIETSSPLGRMIAEQVAARFVQLGYSVKEVKLRDAINVQPSAGGGAQGGEFVTSRDSKDLAPTTQVDAVITGTYALADDSALVNLRLVDIGTGRILAAFDYSLVMTDDIERLSENSNADYGIFGQGWAK